MSEDVKANKWAHVYYYDDPCKGWGMGPSVAYIELGPEMLEVRTPGRTAVFELTDEGWYHVKAASPRYDRYSHGVHVIDGAKIPTPPAVIPLESEEAS